MTQAFRPRRPAFEDYFHTVSSDLYDPDLLQRSKTYSPSWFQGEKTRIEIMTEAKNNGKVLPELFLKGKSFDIDPSKMHGQLYITLPPWMSLDNGDVVYQHDFLEQEYQYLRKSLIAEKETDEKQENVSKEKKKKKKKVKIMESPRVASQNRLNIENGVSITEYLQTTDNGMDHFQKHLQCVKKLARKNKKYRKASAQKGES